MAMLGAMLSKDLGQRGNRPTHGGRAAGYACPHRTCPALPGLRQAHDHEPAVRQHLRPGRGLVCRCRAVTQEIFNTAKSLNRNSHPGSAGESTRVFYRKIRCGHCGLAMERLQSAHPCYVCRTDRYKPDIGCPQDRIDEKELEQTVLAAIRMMAQLVRGAVQAKQRQSAKDTRYNQRLDRQIKAHQNSIQMRQQEKMAAFEDMVSGKVSAEDYQHKRGQCEKHIQRLETKIKELGDAKRRAKEEELSTYNIIPYTNVRTLTRELVDLLIQNIYIYSSTSIEIVWKCGDEYQRLLADTTKKEAAEREQG